MRAEDGESLLGLARSLDVDLVVVGPEAPLVAGVADVLRRNGVAVFGPGRAAARIEGSKSFAKAVLAAAGVPTAEALAVARPRAWSRSTGWRRAKASSSARPLSSSTRALRAAAAFPGPIVIEELLVGEEVSVFALADGRGVCRWHRRRTSSGSATATPDRILAAWALLAVPGMGAGAVAELVEQIHKPVVEELARRGAPFVGVLFAGLMLTPRRSEGARVQLSLRRSRDPVDSAAPGRRFPRRARCGCGGELEGVELTASDEAAVTVVLAGGQYPESSDTGSAIEGIEEAEAAGALVFHAGTALYGERLVTNGGRILGVTGTGATDRRGARQGLRRLRADHVRRRAIPQRHRSHSFRHARLIFPGSISRVGR